MKEVSTYLTFDGNCRQAMEFYKRCLGGELYLMPFSEAPGEMPKDAKNRIMHANLRNGSIALMASDRWGDHPYQTGNNFAICIAPESLAETEKLFAELGEKRHGHHGASGYVLGRPLRNSRRSIRNPLDVQFRKTEIGAFPVGAITYLANSRDCPSWPGG
jgi:PhnB protein